MSTIRIPSFRVVLTLEATISDGKSRSRKIRSAPHSERIIFQFSSSSFVSRLPEIARHRGSTMISISLLPKPGTSARTVYSLSDSNTFRGTGCNNSDSARDQSSISCPGEPPWLSKSSNALRAMTSFICENWLKISSLPCFTDSVPFVRCITDADCVVMFHLLFETICGHPYAAPLLRQFGKSVRQIKITGGMGLSPPGGIQGTEMSVELRKGKPRMCDSIASQEMMPLRTA